MNKYFLTLIFLTSLSVNADQEAKNLLETKRETQKRVTSLLSQAENLKITVTSPERNLIDSKVQKSILAPKKSSISSLGGQEGNGGAGIKRNGVPMTFGSAKIWVDADPIQEIEVPSLIDILDKVINDFPIHSQEKQTLFEAIRPSEKRKYYKVQEDQFTATIKQRLLEEFSRVISADSSDLTLFAVTDTNAKITYLLPDYFLLSKVEQMAILVHEAYWILKPNATYHEVISVEVATQKFLENKNDAQASLKVSKAFSENYGQLIYSSLLIDKQHNIKNGISLLKEDQFSIDARFLFGENYKNCVKAEQKECRFAFLRYWMDLKKGYPNSSAIQALADLILKNEFDTGYSAAYLTALDTGVIKQYYGGCEEISTPSNYEVVTCRIDPSQLSCSTKSATAYRVFYSNNSCGYGTVFRASFSNR